MESEHFFKISDLAGGITEYSPNVTFLKSLLTKMSINRMDFLACNLLQYTEWTQYLDLLKSFKTGLVVGASNDQTGNLQYGGNWTMENTLENIKTLDLIYKELGNDLSVPDIDLKKFDREVVKNLFLNGKLIRVSKNILYTEEHMQRVKALIQQLPSTFTIGQFKSESGLSRKYTIPLLEILDNKQITKKIDSDGLREKLVG